MPVLARTVGGPGAGKTHRALEILEMCLEKVVSDPLRLGFVSFTRAARREASSRAADKFGLKVSALERDGYFRTLHSVCYRALGISDGALLVGGAEDTEWLRKALNDPGARLGRRDEDEDLLVFSTDANESCKALALWDISRNRQIPLKSIHDHASFVDDRFPDLPYCHLVVKLYEAAKALAGRLDFSDLLMRFAGRKWTGDNAHPFTEVEPEGNVPMLPVWIHDEAQDSSLLNALVFRRLIAPSQFVYFMGDEWQSIFGWCGADPNIFRDWPVAKEECLPTSYRCPSRILALADGIMLRGGHQPRPFASHREGGEIRRRALEDALGDLKPGEDVLVLARTNEYARQAAQYLDEALIPWRPTKGGGGWSAPARAAGIVALETLRTGGEIDGEAIHRLLQLLPSSAGGTKLFVRGIKAKFEDPEIRESVEGVGLAKFDVATEPMREAIASGRYKELLEPPAARMAAAAQQHGVGAIEKPTIQIGTCHSAKGMGAAHVVAINQVSYPTRCACQTAQGMDEERRLWFVTCSRASERLTIAETRGEPFSDL